MRKLLKVLACMVSFTAIFCVVIATLLSVSQSPDAAAQLIRWFEKTWVLWLAWRLIIYAVTAYFTFQCWQRKKSDPVWRRAILRIGGIGVLYIAIMEWVLYASTGGH